MKLFLIIVIFFGCFSDALAEQKVNINTYDILPPFAFRDKAGKLTGIYIEIVKTAISRMPDYSSEFVVMPWSRAKKEIEDGEAFAILPPYFHAHDWLTKTGPHRPYIWPYSISLYTQYDLVICHEDVFSKTRAKFPEDYEGLTFSMFRGDGRAGEKFRKMVDKKKINLILLKDVSSTVEFLFRKRADCIITSKLPFFWYANKLKRSGEIPKDAKTSTFRTAVIISTNDGYLGYSDVNVESKFPFKKDFSIKFDIEVYKMKRSGEIQKIIDSFITPYH